MISKELELEAEKEYPDGAYLGYEQSAFIAGATSKYVEKQKLEFAIKQLKSLRQVHDESVMSERVRKVIKDLEQKLAELDD